MRQDQKSGKTIPDNTITADDVLGKNVITPDGSIIGVSSQIHLDPNTLEVYGISIDKGFLKKGLFIGTAYIKEVTDHAVLLSSTPVYELKGKQVFDTNGSRIGVVSSISLIGKKNSISHIIVKTGIMNKELRIPEHKISMIGESIFLNVAKDNI